MKSLIPLIPYSSALGKNASTRITYKQNNAFYFLSYRINRSYLQAKKETKLKRQLVVQTDLADLFDHAFILGFQSKQVHSALLLSLRNGGINCQITI